MSYLINLALRDRPAVVVGGGAVASRKALDLLAAGARVTVIAPQACQDMRRLAETGRVEARWRPYEHGDLNGAFVVVAATGDEAVNARVSRDAQELGLLVNVVDRPALCTFTLPADLRRGHLTIAVATDGLCPAFASVLREELEARYGPEFAELTALLGELRSRMVADHWEGPQIRQAVAAIYRAGIAEALRAGDRPRVDAIVRQFLPDRPESGWPDHKIRA